MLANRCYGRITKTLLPLLMAVHIGARPIYLIRAGAAEGGSLALADSFKEKSVSKIAALNPEGRKFAAKLAEWLTAKVEDFITETKGRARAQSVVRLTDGRQHMGVKCKVMTSTLPRAAATAELIGESEQYTTLNPLDKGMLAHLSLKEISEHQKKFYRQWQKEPFRTRFPGGWGLQCQAVPSPNTRLTLGRSLPSCRMHRRRVLCGRRVAAPAAAH